MLFQHFVFPWRPSNASSHTRLKYPLPSGKAETPTPLNSPPLVTPSYLRQLVLLTSVNMPLSHAPLPRDRSGGSGQVCTLFHLSSGCFPKSLPCFTRDGTHLVTLKISAVSKSASMFDQVGSWGPFWDTCLSATSGKFAYTSHGILLNFLIVLAACLPTARYFKHDSTPSFHSVASYPAIVSFGGQCTVFKLYCSPMFLCACGMPLAPSPAKKTNRA